MTSKFLGFFRKKSSNKENDPELERDMSYRRSVRSISGSTKGSRRERTTRFECPEGDEYLAPTAPYHTVTAPKMHRGPQSAPGGYRDDFDDELNRSFQTEVHRDNRRDRREKNTEYRIDKYRRSNRDTSEYGSGDPSPIGNVSTRHHYTQELNEDSDNDYETAIKLNEMERAYNRLRKEYKLAEESRQHYKKEVKRMMRLKDEMEKAFMAQMQRAANEKKVLEMKVKQLEQQVQQQRMMLHPPANSYVMGASPFCQPPAPSHQFAPFGHQQPGVNRMSVMPPTMMPMSSNTTTPITNTTRESSNGAGEALAETSDLSCLQPNLFDSSYSSRQMTEDDTTNQSANRSNDTNYSEAYPYMDEVKHFTSEDPFEAIETPRGGCKIESTSSIVSRQHHPLLLKQADSGSTVVDDEESDVTRNFRSVDSAPSAAAPLRRSASDSAFPVQPLRHTTL